MKTTTFRISILKRTTWLSFLLIATGAFFLLSFYIPSLIFLIILLGFSLIVFFDYPAIKIDKEGIVDKSSYFFKQTVKWEDINEIKPAFPKKKDLRADEYQLVICLKKNHDYKPSNSFFGKRHINTLEKLYGSPIVINCQNLGVHPDSLKYWLHEMQKDIRNREV